MERQNAFFCLSHSFSLSILIFTLDFDFDLDLSINCCLYFSICFMHDSHLLFFPIWWLSQILNLICKHINSMNVLCIFIIIHTRLWIEIKIIFVYELASSIQNALAFLSTKHRYSRLFYLVFNTPLLNDLQLLQNELFLSKQEQEFRTSFFTIKNYDISSNVKTNWKKAKFN